MVLNDGSFVNAVMALATSDRRGSTRIDAEFETKHGARGAVGVEGIPVGVNDVKEFSAEIGFKIVRYVEVFIEEGLMLDRVPFDQVRAGRNFIHGVGLA